MARIESITKFHSYMTSLDTIFMITFYSSVASIAIHVIKVGVYICIILYIYSYAIQDTFQHVHDYGVL